jgi:hypothetical protein
VKFTGKFVGDLRAIWKGPVKVLGHFTFVMDKYMATLNCEVVCTIPLKSPTCNFKQNLNIG